MPQLILVRSRSLYSILKIHNQAKVRLRIMNAYSRVVRMGYELRPKYFKAATSLLIFRKSNFRYLELFPLSHSRNDTGL